MLFDQLLAVLKLVGLFFLSCELPFVYKAGVFSYRDKIGDTHLSIVKLCFLFGRQQAVGGVPAEVNGELHLSLIRVMIRLLVQYITSIINCTYISITTHKFVRSIGIILTIESNSYLDHENYLYKYIKLSITKNFLRRIE